VTTTIKPSQETSKTYGLTLTPVVPQIEGEGKDSNFGKEAVIKTFYEGPRSSCRCCINWVDHKPDELNKAVAKSHNEAAIRLYKVNDHSPGNCVFEQQHALKFHSLEIQSPFIVAAIKQVLEDSGMFLTDNQTAKFSAPFRELYFCYDKIVDIQQQYSSTVEDITKKHLELLTNLMNELFGNTVAEVKNLLEKELICFDHIWTIFRKGTTVYSKVDGQDRLYRVTKVDLIKPTQDNPFRYWLIECQYVQFDGTDFGLSTTKFFILEFLGNQRISSLSVYPLGFHENPHLEARLMERGKRMLDFQDMSYYEYNGIGIDETPENEAKYTVCHFH
jgi:hypothetical protein